MKDVFIKKFSHFFWGGIEKNVIQGGGTIRVAARTERASQAISARGGSNR